MLRQFWKTMALFPLLHPMWFNLFLLVLAWSLMGVAYQTNDDLVIASILDGWGDPSYADAHVIFVNPLLTGFLLKFAPFLGGLSVWPVFLLLATFSSGTAMFAMLTAHARKVRVYDFSSLVVVLMWFLMMPSFYSALQFTQVAFLMGFTGVLVCLKYGSFSWKGWLAGVFLCVLGSMIRLDTALVCGAFWGAILLVGSLDGFSPSRKKLLSLKRLWLALACVLITSFTLNEYNKFSHRNVLEGCDVVAWNHARSLLSDTSPIRQESAYQCGKYGVFANDIKMVRTFTNCDMDVFNVDYLERLLLARDGDNLSFRVWARGQNALRLFSWDSVMNLLPCWVLAGLALRVSFLRGDPPPRRYCVCALLMFILLHMASIDRLCFRVVYPTFLMAVSCLLWSESYSPVRVRWRGKEALAGGAFLTGAFAVFLFQVSEVRDDNPESLSSEAGRLLRERVEREPYSLFCVQMADRAIDDLVPGHSVFRKAWSCSRKNVVTLGGWNFPLRPVQRKLKEMGWEGASSLNLCREHVYIVCLTPQGDVSGDDRKFLEMLSCHIREHYGASAAFHLDENLQGARVFQLAISSEHGRE